jgi:hypothetical protein
MLTKQHVLTTTCALAELECAYYKRRPDPHDPVYITFHGAVQDLRDDKCSDTLQHVEQFLNAMGYRDNMTEDEILDMLSGTGFEV